MRSLEFPGSTGRKRDRMSHLNASLVTDGQSTDYSRARSSGDLVQILVLDIAVMYARPTDLISGLHCPPPTGMANASGLHVAPLVG